MANGNTHSIVRMESVYGAANSRKLNIADNPESYVYAAIAAYMYLNAPSGMDPIVFQIKTGIPKKAKDV